MVRSLPTTCETMQSRSGGQRSQHTLQVLGVVGQTVCGRRRRTKVPSIGVTAAPNIRPIFSSSLRRLQ